MVERVEYSPHGVLLRFVEKYIGGRQNIKPAIGELRNRPEVLDELASEFDLAVGSLNTFTQASRVETDADSLLPNAVRIRSLLKGKSLPSLEEIGQDKSLGTVKEGIRTFRGVDSLMKSGETGRSGPKWEFHQNITDAGQLAAALMLEIYGKYVERRYPELRDRGFDVVLSLEEMLAIHHQDTQLFEAVKGWYDVKEGFSQKLVDGVQGMGS